LKNKVAFLNFFLPPDEVVPGADWPGRAGAEQRSDAACTHVAQMEDMAMSNFGLTPLWRSTGGFDPLEPFPAAPAFFRAIRFAAEFAGTPL
jgi:hypothetical protein